MLQFSYNLVILHLPRTFSACALLAALFFFWSQPLAAQVETQHVINAPWQINPRVDITLHGRLRTRPTSQGLYQVRAGALLGLRLSPRWKAIAGYYFSEVEETKDWEGWNRTFGGVEHRLGTSKGTWSARHLAELFDAPRGLVYYRVRHRVGWESASRLAPYSNVEYFWDNQAWRSVRYQVGLRYKITPRTSWDFHYFHEPRRQDVGWWSRNMWGTTLEVRLDDPEKRNP